MINCYTGGGVDQMNFFTNMYFTDLNDEGTVFISDLGT